MEENTISSRKKSDMGGPEDTLSGTHINIQNKTSTNTDNNQSNKISVQGTQGGRRTKGNNVSNNVTNTKITSTKDYRGKIETFGAVLVLR